MDGSDVRQLGPYTVIELLGSGGMGPLKETAVTRTRIQRGGHIGPAVRRSKFNNSMLRLR